ncbi:Fic/DOC family protein [Thiorhodovibrio litoralis]|uniref:Fic family protein n=1 Tax=Thiorhodovibrio winogradskyi TaxID=77007 RepID=UPI001914D9A6|nr:Fic family protein [Thiorhodovibrio winogradskyi]MBK5968900.1 cell filamentation protein Fic [Thiorhodovibrio winogradskyi]WPL12714.1 Fic/DOC family protein [Thiorhodovibrio litoralis]
MPKKIPAEELNAILALVGNHHPNPVQVRTIRDGLADELPPRMLQRRLALLVDQRRLTAEGRGKGRRYRLPPNHFVMQARPGQFEISGQAVGLEIYPPVSPEALAIKEAVRAPIQHRQPVSYQRAFLERYRPNQTFYLTEETRQRLVEMGRPPDAERPAGTYARRIYNRLLIDLSWNSSRLEGNTYSLLETERLLELGEAAEGKDALEAQMILNHKAAIELLVEQADEIGFNHYTILNLHGLLADNLLADPLAGGRLRTIGVGIAGTLYYPLDVPQLIEECFRQVLDTAAAIADPFEQAFFALVHLAYLQPFEDVNKRVSRLAANIPLIRQNLCPLSFVDVPERAYIDGVLGVYEMNRIELLRDVFIWAYQRSCARYSAVRQSLGEPDRFRLRYRALIAEMVAKVVRDRLDKKAATALIRQGAAEQLPAEDQGRFVEVAETELMSLHEGNIARYRLRPAEYQVWRQGWH